ncbi:MAG TPA: hypothetical protein VHX65_01380 [Pirellulales bacterium]|jgi:hypothetical protein|nr:hypothetical protein [Pirellulales bacterium]
MSHAAHIAGTSFLMHQMLAPRMPKKSAEKAGKPFPSGESLEGGAVRPVNDERRFASGDPDAGKSDGSDTEDGDAARDNGSGARGSDESHALDLTI